MLFKPNETRGARYSSLKYSPKASWGVFAGYKLVAGYKWRGEYLVWDLSTFKNATLLVTSTKHDQAHVSTPHATKVVVLPQGDLRFPLKADYDRVNTSLFDQSVVNSEDNAISMAHPFVGPGKGLSVLPEELPVIGPEHDHLETLDHGDDDAEIETPEELALRKQENENIAFNRDTFPHVRTGRAQDGVVYVNDSGQSVRLDKNGRQFKCDLDGVRNTRQSARPEGMEPEVWNVLRVHRQGLAKKEEKAKAAQDKLGQNTKAVPLASPDAGGASSALVGCCNGIDASASEVCSVADSSDGEYEKAMPAVLAPDDYEKVESDVEDEDDDRPPMTAEDQRAVRLLENSDTDTESANADPMVLLDPDDPLYEKRKTAAFAAAAVEEPEWILLMYEIRNWKQYAFVDKEMAKPAWKRLMREIRNYSRLRILDPEKDRRQLILALYTMHNDGDLDTDDLAMALSREDYNVPDLDEPMTGTSQTVDHPIPIDPETASMSDPDEAILDSSDRIEYIMSRQREVQKRELARSWTKVNGELPQDNWSRMTRGEISDYELRRLEDIQDPSDAASSCPDYYSCPFYEAMSTSEELRPTQQPATLLQDSEPSPLDARKFAV